MISDLTFLHCLDANHMGSVSTSKFGERGIVEFVCLIINNLNFHCCVVLSLSKTQIVFGRVLKMPFKSWQRTRHEILRLRLRIIHEYRIPEVSTEITLF